MNRREFTFQTGQKELIEQQKEDATADEINRDTKQRIYCLKWPDIGVPSEQAEWSVVFIFEGGLTIMWLALSSSPSKFT